MARLKLRLAIFAIILVPACAIGFSLGGTAGAFVCALLSLSILIGGKTPKSQNIESAWSTRGPFSKDLY